MYFFDKKTMYLVWNMQEGQARGVGTVKFLAMDEICRIEVAITGCGKVQGTYPVYVLSGDMQSILGEIVLNKGKGNFYIKCGTNTLGHKAFTYKQVTGLRIDLKTEGYLEQKWLPMQESVPVEKRVEGEKVKVQESTPAERKKQSGVMRSPEPAPAERKIQSEVMRNQKTATAERKQQSEVMRSQEPAPAEWKKPKGVLEIYEEESERKGANNAVLKERQSIDGERMLESKEPETTKQIKKSADEVKPPEKDVMALYPNKWQQLCAIYPVVHPFQDGRAYLSIEPRDFVVLQERYQPMVQNSFLLHGFYHYRHLLLGRHQQGKNVQYYLGVPGVFYEKEKAAALFYGFESFEGPVTPAREGSFGYYMKRVQI